MLISHSAYHVGKFYESPLLLAENDSAQYFAFIAKRYVLPILFGSFIMVKDLVLLCGSIKQKKGALIAVAIMEAITILCMFAFGIYRFTILDDGFDLFSTMPKELKGSLIIFASNKLWNILVILGAIQQVKKKMINQRHEIATEMS